MHLHQGISYLTFGAEVLKYVWNKLGTDERPLDRLDGRSMLSAISIVNNLASQAASAECHYWLSRPSWKSSY
jgi:hypothetical protein